MSTQKPWYEAQFCYFSTDPHRRLSVGAMYIFFTQRECYTIIKY